jgi:hypothetical protein
MNFLEHAILNQKGHRHWAVFDSAILNAATPIIPDWEAEKIKLEASNSSMFHSSDDLTSLAIKAGLNPRNLHRTGKKYIPMLHQRQKTNINGYSDLSR